MSDRRIAASKVSEIGSKRIESLFEMSEASVRDGREDRAKRYVEIARNIGMRTRTRLHNKGRFCKNCNLPLMPGVNCTVRLSNHKVCIKCDSCGEVRRIPYIREQRQ